MEIVDSSFYEEDSFCLWAIAIPSWWFYTFTLFLTQLIWWLAVKSKSIQGEDIQLIFETCIWYIEIANKNCLLTDRANYFSYNIHELPMWRKQLLLAFSNLYKYKTKIAKSQHNRDYKRPTKAVVSAIAWICESELIGTVSKSLSSATCYFRLQKRQFLLASCNLCFVGL